MPKVSVIIPCYNVEKYIDRCLDSLQNQTLKDLEIICIDDKSTDDTLSIIQSHAKNDTRIYVIKHKVNSGAAVARNSGLDIARGKYIGFVDPDDYVDSDFYEKLYNCALQTKSCIAKANVIQTDTNTGFANEHKLNKYVRRDILFFSSTFWSAIYDRKFLLKHHIRFPDNIRTSQDSVFLTLITLCTDKIAVIDDTYYHYFYQRAGSLDSATLPHWKAESKLNSFKLNLGYIEKSNLPKDRFLLALKQHVVGHAIYELKKKYDILDDQQDMFIFLSDVINKYQNMIKLKRDIPKHIYKSLKHKDFCAFQYYESFMRTRWYLFHFIPFINVDIVGSNKIVFLFDLFPLLRIFENRRYYLLGFIPILKIKR